MCVFCKIINKEIPSSTVYEDDNVLAILDLSQATYGHTLVMPKKHVETFLDLDKETLNNVFSVTQDLAIKIKDKLGASGVNILNNSYPVAGQSVMHMHVHIIPRYSNQDDFKVVNVDHSDTIKLSEVLAKIND